MYVFSISVFLSIRSQDGYHAEASPTRCSSISVPDTSGDREFSHNLLSSNIHLTFDDLQPNVTIPSHESNAADSALDTFFLKFAGQSVRAVL